MNTLLAPTGYPPCSECGRPTCEGTHAIDANEQRAQRELTEALEHGQIVGRALPVERAADAAASSVLARRIRDAATFKIPRRR